MANLEGERRPSRYQLQADLIKTSGVIGVDHIAEHRVVTGRSDRRLQRVDGLRLLTKRLRAYAQQATSGENDTNEDFHSLHIRMDT